MINWMQTTTGRAFDLDNPTFHFEDIAVALSKIARYGGHTKGFAHYSVAEHCVLMSRYKEWDKNRYTKRQRWNILMHDSTEAYLMDLVRPWKAKMPSYRKNEDALFSAIAKRFDLEDPIPDYVKELDNRILGDEKAQVMADPPRPWSDTGEPLGVKIKCWDPAHAYKHFMLAAQEFAHVPLD